MNTDKITSLPYAPVVAEIIALLNAKQGIGASWGQYNDVTWGDLKIQDSFGYLIVVGKYSIMTYNDNSGPTVRIWVGESLGNKKNLNLWLDQHFVVTKAQKQPRNTLLYGGSDEKNSFTWYYTERSQRSLPKYIISDNDLGREYDPQQGDVKFFETPHFLQLITDELKIRLEKLKAA